MRRRSRRSRRSRKMSRKRSRRSRFLLIKIHNERVRFPGKEKYYFEHVPTCTKFPVTTTTTTVVVIDSIS